MYACAVRDASAFSCYPLIGSSYDHTARNRYRNNRYSVLRTLVSVTYILVRSTCTEVPSYLEGMIAVWPGNMRGASYYLTLTVKILFHNVPTNCYSGMQQQAIARHTYTYSQDSCIYPPCRFPRISATLVQAMLPSARPPITDVHAETSTRLSFMPSGPPPIGTGIY